MSNQQKVFDCFTFYDELDLLEIRLNILNDVVDYFVLSESTRTFTGKPKSLNFEKNKARFKNFAHKIRHVIVDEEEFKPEINAWQRESDQRNSVLKGVYDCKDNDYIIVSDLDEIVNPDAVTATINKNSNSISAFMQPCYYYFLNCRSTEVINMAKMAKFKNVRSPQQLRVYPKVSSFNSNKLAKMFCRWRWIVRKRLWPLEIQEDGGWHFTYMQSPENISKKIMAFSHTEFDSLEFTSVNSIQSRIRGVKDPFDRDYELEIIDIDDSFPDYIYKNQDKYPHLIYGKKS